MGAGAAAAPLPPPRPWCAPTPTPTPTGSPTPWPASPTNPVQASPVGPLRQPHRRRPRPRAVGASRPPSNATSSSPPPCSNLLYTNTPAAITTPPLIWWHGTVPDDTDTTWETTPVPGWNGTLGDYLAALVDDYATNPDHNWDDHQCIPPAATACGQPAETDSDPRHHPPLRERRRLHSTRATPSPHDGRNGSGNADRRLPVHLHQPGATTAATPKRSWPHPTSKTNAPPTDVTTILDAFDGDPAWVPDRLVRRHGRRPQRPRRHLVTRLRPQPRVQPHLDRRLPSPLARLLHDHRPARRRRHRHRLPARRPSRRRLGRDTDRRPLRRRQPLPLRRRHRGPAAPSSATAATATPSPPAPSSTTAPGSSSPPGEPPASTSSPSTASTAPKRSRTHRSRRSTPPPSSPATSPSTPCPPAASATSS